MVKEVERRLRVTEPVIKFITVRVDEEQKRLAKIKAIRDTKVRGKGTALLQPKLPQPRQRPMPAGSRSGSAGERSGRRRRNDSGQRITGFVRAELQPRRPSSD